MSKLILLEGNFLTSIDNIECCWRDLKDDWYLDDDGNNRQYFCELVRIKLKDKDAYSYNHVFDKFLQAIEEGMKSDDPIIRPPITTKDDWD